MKTVNRVERRGVLILGTALMVQAAFLLTSFYLSFNWPGYPAPDAALKTAKVLAWAPVVLLACIPIAWLGILVESRHKKGSERLLRKPALGTMVVTTLVLLTVALLSGSWRARSADEFALYLVYGVGFGLIPWGVPTLLLGLLVRWAAWKLMPEK